ncbi:MAG: hypothetical protein ONB24_11890, partial [candidate division KSB1 bacterium]|nr:hypothetical protein [candidate division KSB1 bacterium]
MKNLQKVAAIFLIAPTLLAQGSRKAINFYDKEKENRTIFVGYCDVNFNLTTALTVTAWVKWADTVNVQDRWANICSNNSQTTSD